ncbi:MAG: beta-galactosidase [Anaerolineae bacterium]
MILGVAYYPEHWPRERWETDARLMRDAGISRIRLAEFAWHRLEPYDGQFRFDWLAEAIDLFGHYGIDTILCTPTPTYPAWLHQKYPDIHQIKSNGQVKEFGQRQDACKNHPGYRLHARRIVEALARELGSHPHVIAWQIDNEFGCHGTARCYCDHCQRAFQAWLRRRFDNDIEALNAAWGTVFWSQEYNDFSEIPVPRDTADQTGNDGHNPSLVLDFYRFSSDVQVAFQREQVEIVRRWSPGRPITHNFMGRFYQINYFDLAEDLDVVSWDNYPFLAAASHRPPSPLPHDLMRGTKRQNVWVMEQASGPGGWGVFAATPAPGQMRLWAYQAVARGADMISFFRWRSCRFGREQYWHGILYHHGQPQRRYREVQQIGQEFQQIREKLDGSTVEAQVAIMLDHDSLWAFETQPQARQGFGYAEMVNAWSEALARLGVTADVVRPGGDLGPYRLVIVPSAHVCSLELASQLTGYVREGGLLILGPRSGVKDVENVIVDELLPGLLRELVGCHVEEYDTFSSLPSASVQVVDEDGHAFQANGLAEVLSPTEEAQVLWRYNGRYYTDEAAAVIHPVDQGLCVYLGTMPDAEGRTAILRRMLSQAQIPWRDDLPEQVEVVTRTKDDARFTFLLNHGEEPVAVRVIRPGTDLLTGAAVGGEVTLPPYGVVIIEEA